LASENSSELISIWYEAKNHLEAGRPDKAIEIYKYVLLRYGDDPETAEYANAYLGDIFLSLHKLDLAEEHIKKAIDHNPEKAEYHYILGFVFNKRRQWEKAISEFKSAVSREPDDAEFIRGLGWATFQNGDRIRGLSLLQKANKLNPSSVNILTDLAVANMGTSLRKARQYAEQAAAIEPDSPLVQGMLDQIRIFEENISQMLDGAHTSWQRESTVRQGSLYVFQFKVSTKDNPGKWCIIEIKANQLLSTLHKGIARAFGYQEAAQFSFFIHRTKDSKPTEFAATVPGVSGTAKSAKIRMDSMIPARDEEQKFSYLYCDEKTVLHEVELVRIINKIPRGEYPRVVKKHG
jgi:tetratricopeptide (TPR) repeat protein